MKKQENLFIELKEASILCLKLFLMGAGLLVLISPEFARLVSLVGLCISAIMLVIVELVNRLELDKTKRRSNRND